MKITVIGFYGGYPYAGQATSSYLVQSGSYNLLLDCGSGALISLEKVLDPLQLDAVLLSHYHADHVADVGVLQHYWQLRAGERKESMLPIYGHELDKANFSKLNWPDSTVARKYDPDKLLDLGPLEVKFMPVQHPVAAFAMRVTEKETGHNFVFTADTRFFSELINFSLGTDLLITDTNFLHQPTGPKWHLTATETGMLAQKAQVKQLLMSHLPQDVLPSELIETAKNQITNDIIIQCASTRLTINI